MCENLIFSSWVIYKNLVVLKLKITFSLSFTVISKVACILEG